MEPARVGTVATDVAPRTSAACTVALLLVLMASSAVSAEAPAAAHQHHAAASSSSGGASRSEHPYRVPDIPLIRSDGVKVSLRAELNDGRPVVMNFVFTSCTAICPMLSQVFAQLQQRLGTKSNTVHLVTVSIDPEHDTPERLREFARRFHAAPGWDFYTGTAQASIDAQKAFGVYRGDKMNHLPTVLLRTSPDRPWVQLSGFVSPAAIEAELAHR